jgi:hypothetical protein
MTFLRYFTFRISLALLVSASWMVSTLDPPLVRMALPATMPMGDVGGFIPLVPTLVAAKPALPPVVAQEECGY